jgi:hypothetical protein
MKEDEKPASLLLPNMRFRIGGEEHKPERQIDVGVGPMGNKLRVKSKGAQACN